MRPLLPCNGIFLSPIGNEKAKEIQFADSLRGWAVSEHKLFQTWDRGATWSVVESSPSSSHYFAGLAVIDTGRVYISRGWYVQGHRLCDWCVWIDEWRNGVWTNCFRDYQYGSTYGPKACRLSSLDADRLWHLGWKDIGHILSVRRTSSGQWEPFSDPFFYWTSYDASFTDTETGWAAWDVVAKTTNAGDSWQTFTANLGARRIQMFDSLNGWVLTTSGLMQTTDGGDSWTTAVPETSLKAMRFCNPRHGVAVGTGGVILHTTDGGATWAHDTSESSLDLYAVCMVDSAHAWAAGDSGVVLGMGDWAAPGMEDRYQSGSPVRVSSVWPNPCRGTLWLACQGGSGSAVVYDGTGCPVARTQCTSGRAERIDLRSLPEGVYFVRVPSSRRAAVRFVLLR